MLLHLLAAGFGHERDIARSRMDFRFRWESGQQRKSPQCRFWPI